MEGKETAIAGPIIRHEIEKQIVIRVSIAHNSSYS